MVLSPDNQEIIFDLNNFFLGGKNIENITKVEALATLSGDNAGLQFVKNTTEEGSSRNLNIQYDKEGALYVHALQVIIRVHDTYYTRYIFLYVDYSVY